ncbi:MAG: hypothetical protein ACXWJM_05620 [Ramlibacter sp.]
MNLKKTTIGLALAAVSLAALASVTFDPTTGIGWVGKGDIQVVYGWTNKQLQNAEKAHAISFQYVAIDDFSAVCEWVTGEGTRGQKTHDVTHSKSTVVNWSVCRAADVLGTGDNLVERQRVDRHAGQAALERRRLHGTAIHLQECFADGTDPIVQALCVGHRVG